MRPDVKLNNVWMSGLGWLRERINFPTPQSQSNTMVVPGRNSPIRYTEALGRVSYQPRSFTITLSMLGSREKFNQRKDILANLYAGLCYYYLGKAKEAVNYLEKYSPASDAMVSPAAVAALGNAYAAVGQLDKAVSKLKDAASKADSESKDGANNSLSPTFLLQAGELLESQNKTDEALKVYQDIKKKYVNSMLVQSNEIDKYIERTTK